MSSKRAEKGSVKSVCSVREKTPQRVTCVPAHDEGAYLFSQSNTEIQRTQSSVHLCEFCSSVLFCEKTKINK